MEFMRSNDNIWGMYQYHLIEVLNNLNLIFSQCTLESTINSFAYRNKIKIIPLCSYGLKTHKCVVHIFFVRRGKFHQCRRGTKRTIMGFSVQGDLATTSRRTLWEFVLILERFIIIKDLHGSYIDFNCLFYFGWSWNG